MLLLILTIITAAVFITFVVANCNESPSERNKDFDNFL
jgi:hypothetical protein